MAEAAFPNGEGDVKEKRPHLTLGKINWVGPYQRSGDPAMESKGLEFDFTLEEGRAKISEESQGAFPVGSSEDGHDEAGGPTVPLDDLGNLSDRVGTDVLWPEDWEIAIDAFSDAVPAEWA